MLLLGVWVLVPLCQHQVFVITSQERVRLGSAARSSMLIIVEHVASISLLEPHRLSVGLLDLEGLSKLLVEADQMLPGNIPSAFFTDVADLLEQINLVWSSSDHIWPNLVTLDFIYFGQSKIRVDPDCAIF